jgi:hypothetical protein
VGRRACAWKSWSVCPWSAWGNARGVGSCGSQIAQLRQQLSAARAEVACLRRQLASSDGGKIAWSSAASASLPDAVLAAAMEELQQQNSALDLENARLRLQLVRAPTAHSVPIVSLSVCLSVCLPTCFSE